MKLLYAAALACASSAVLAEPVELVKRAKCADDGFYAVFVQNAAIASSFCSDFYIPTATVKATTTSVVVTTSTVRTITSKKTTPVITSTTTLATLTLTATVTTSSPALKKRDATLDLQERQAPGLPDFVLSYESVMASSACSCLLSTVTATSTLTKTSTSVVRVTATQLGTTSIISLVTLPTGTVTTTVTTTAGPSCPTDAIENGSFENGLAPWFTADTGGTFISQAPVQQQPCQSGWFCGLIIGEPGYDAIALAPLNTCAGSSYLITAYTIVFTPGTTTQSCQIALFVVNSGLYTVSTLQYYDVTDDDTYHVLSGTYTEEGDGTNLLMLRVLCPNFGSNITVLLDTVSAIKQ